jgi:hypothetical protein
MRNYVGETSFGTPLTDFQLKLADLKRIIEKHGRKSEQAEKAFQSLLLVCNKFIPSEEKLARETYKAERQVTLSNFLSLWTKIKSRSCVVSRG